MSATPATHPTAGNPLARTSTIAWLLVMAAVAALAIAGRFVGEINEREQDMTDAAYRNPLLALGMLQEQLGAQVTFHGAWRGLPPDGGTLWLAVPGRMLGDATVQALLDWVTRGGRLVVMPLQKRLWRNGDPLLEGAGIHQETLDRADLYSTYGTRATRQQVLADGMYWQTDDGGRLRAGVFSPDDILIADDAAAQGLLCHALGCPAVRVPHGDGSISVLSEAQLLTNTHLNAFDHAAIAWRLAPVQAGNDVHIVYGARVPGLDELLWQQASIPLLAIIAAVLVWLWHVTARPGPVLPSPLPARRRLGEHITATGHFLAAHGGAHVLWQASRAACLQRLARRYPQLADVEDAPSLAAATGWPLTGLTAALSPPDDDSWAACATRIAQLEVLGKH